MFGISKFWRKDEAHPTSWRQRAAARMRMALGVEGLETRIMLDASVGDDVSEPVVSPVVDDVAIAVASDVSDGSDLSNPSDGADHSDDASLVIRFRQAPAAVAEVAEASDGAEPDSEILRNSAATEATRARRPAPMTYPEITHSDDRSGLAFAAPTDVRVGDFEYLVGHETRGPPASGTDPTSDFVLIPPLSSNDSATTTCDDPNCPPQDGSDGVCTDSTLDLGSQDTLGGNQTIDQPVINGGLVSPGNSPGILVFADGFVQTANGTLLIEIFGPNPGTGYDQVQVTGDVTLDGLLRVLLDPTYAATLTGGEEFVFIEYTGTLTGDFANVTGLGIHGSTLHLEIVHDTVNKQVLLRVVNLSDTLSAEFKTALQTAVAAFSMFGDRIYDLLPGLSAPLPVLGISFADFLRDAAGGDFADFLDFSDAADDLVASADNTFANLSTLFESHLAPLIAALDQGIFSISAYLINVAGRNELHVEFVLDLAQSMQLTGRDLNAILPAATLAQMGLSFSSDIDFDAEVGVYANFAMVIDVTNPTTITSDDISLELNELQVTLDVDTTINTLTVDWSAFGTGLSITDGFARTNELMFAVSLDGLNGINRITLTDLNGLISSGLPAAIRGELSGELEITLPVDVNFAGALNPFGKPIIQVTQDFDWTTGQPLSAALSTAPVIAVDLDITPIESEILALLGHLSFVRPDLNQLPFEIPASFGLEALFDGISTALTLQPVAQRYFDAIAAFNLTLPADLPQFRTLLGLAVDFDDTSGDTSTNSDLVLLADALQTQFDITLPAGDLTFADMQTAVFAQLGSFASMSGLIAYLQASISDIAQPNPIGLSTSPVQFQMTLTGGYFEADQEIRLDVQFEFTGSASFTAVDLNELQAIVTGALRDIKNHPLFGQFTGLNADPDGNPQDLSAAILQLIVPDGVGSTAGIVELAFGGLLDVSIGLDIADVLGGSASIGPDIAFLRLNQLQGFATLDITQASLQIEVGEFGTIALDQIELHAAVGTTLPEAQTVTLNDLITDGVSAFIDGLNFDPTGSVSGSLPLVTVVAGFDTSEFGTPVLVVEDGDLFDTEAMQVRVSVIIGPTLQTVLLDLANQWDALITTIVDNPVLSTLLPLLGQSANELIAGPNNVSLATFLSLHTTVSDYFATAGTVTTEGLLSALSTVLNARITDVAAALPIDILGGLFLEDEELRIDLVFDLEQAFGFDVDIIDILGDAGPTADVLADLAALGVELTGDFRLDVIAYLQGTFSFVVDLSGLFASGTAPTADDAYVAIDEAVMAGATVTASSIDFGITLTSGSTNYAPRIEDGTIVVDMEAELDLAAATGGQVSAAALTAGPIGDLIDVSYTGTLDSRFPILGLFDAIDAIDGTFVLRVVDDELFNLTASPTAIIDAEFSISDFVYVRGSIAGFLGTQVDVTLEDGVTMKNVNVLSIGIGDADIFIGINGPTLIDLDGNGTVDADEINDEAVGLVVNGANIGIALMKPTLGADPTRYIGVMGTVDAVTPVGLPDEFELTFTNLDFTYNFGTDQAVDFAASFGGGLVVTTGADDVTLDMTGTILRAETDATLNLGNFVLVTGTFAFSLGGTGEVVVDETGIAKTVNIFTIGAHNVNIFVGAMNAAGDDLVAGIQMTGVSFGIAVMAVADPTDDGLYFAMKASAATVAPVGLPPEIVLNASNVTLAINDGSSGAVDFTHANTTFGGNPGPLSVDTGGENMGAPITVDLDFDRQTFEASALLTLSLGGFIHIEGTFAFRRGPAQAVTLTDDSQKQVSTFTIGGTGASVFVGIDGPPSTNPAAQGFALTDVEFGLAILTSLEAADNSVYFAMEATIGSATTVNLPDFGLSTGLITLAVNASTDPTGEVVNFATSAFDGSDADSDPDGLLEVFTGGEQPVEIDLTESLLRIEIANGAITIDDGSTMHTMSGDYLFEISQDGMGQDQFIVGVSNLAFSGAGDAIQNAVGVMVIKSAGVALLVYGEAAASAGSVGIEAGLGLRVNTTGGAVNETITIDSRNITINSTGDEVVFFVTNLTLTIGDFVYLSGSLTVGQAITLSGGESAMFTSGTAEIFVGLGPYLLETGDVNPDAVGILITGAVVGMLTDVNGGTGVALWAEGDVQFIGIDGLVVGGTVRVELNTTGVAITDDLELKDIDDNTIGTAEFDFTTTDVIKRVVGDVSVAVPNVFEIDGQFTFTKLPNDAIEIDVANMTLRIMPESATDESFSITAHATFTLDKVNGFKLRFIQVVNFSIFDLDAGIPSGGAPPPELAQTLGFPDVTVGAGGEPIAALINPMHAATLDSTSLNARQFIDITFSVGTTDITDIGAEFTLTGTGVTADLMIDNSRVEHLYGTTYRYYLVDADPTNNVGLFTDGTVTVNFIAGSFTNSLTSVTNLADSTNSFTVMDGANSATSGVTFNVGPFQIVGPTLSLEDFSYTDGTLLLTIGLGADEINLGFGDGQSNSGVTAQMTNVLFTFDVELGFDITDLGAFISDPLAHVSGPSLTGKFSLRAQTLDLVIPGIFEIHAEGVNLAYDPAITGTQTLLTIATTELVFPAFNLTGTIENLVIRTDGFAFDDAEIEWNAPAGMPLSMGGLFEFSSLGVGISDFDITFGDDFVFTGSLTFFTDAAVFLPGRPIEATVSQRPGSTQHGMSATLNFDDEGNLDSLEFHIDQIEIKFGQFLTFTGSDIDIDTGAWGDAGEQLVSFGSIGAKVKLGSLIIAGEGRNFAFMGDGSFLALPGFVVIISADTVDGAGIGWPSWMPIRIIQIGMQWPDINNDPGNFRLTVSAEVTGLHNLPLQFTGLIDGIVIDIPKLIAGEFPVVDIASLGVSVSGPMFGGELTGTLLGGILKLDADGNVLDPLAPEEDIAERIFFLGVEGGFAMPGIGGVTIRFALSELGPLGVFLHASTPTGIIVDPTVTGLAFNDFSGGVEFFTSLPDYTDPFQLRGSSFGLPTDMTPAEWLVQIKDQVAAQWLSLQMNPDQEGFTAAFTEVMTITGGAKIFSIYTSQHTFNGEVILKFSTDGKFALTGKLNFAHDTLSISAKMFADLSALASGDAKFLFLADVPDQAPVLTYFGEFSMDFITNPMDPGNPSVVLDLQGGMIFQAPLGVVGDITGTNVTDVELFRIDGGVTLTIDSARPAFIVDVNGTMSVVYLGNVGSAAGRLVLAFDAMGIPELWGVLRMETGLDKLRQLGLEVTGEVLLQINTTGEEKNEILALAGVVGTELATVTDAAALAALDALSPVIPPLGLDPVPASVAALLTRTDLGIDVDLDASNGLQAITLSGDVSVEVVVTGASWKVIDNENGTIFFIDQTAGGALRISGEAQLFTLDPLSVLLEIRGELIFRLPAFLPDGVTPGPSVFVFAGAAFMKVNQDGLEAFLLGRIKVGPSGAELLEFDAQGALVINDEGVAAGLSLTLDANRVPGITLNGNFGMAINTTTGLQKFYIPERFQAELLPPEPPIPPSANPGDLIPASPTNITLYWEVSADGLSLIPVLLVPGEAPDVNGNFDPMAANTPYIVAFGDATMGLGEAGSEVLILNGRFHFTLETDRVAALAAFSTSIPILGTATGNASFVLDGDGVYGRAEMTLDAIPAIPNLDATLSLLLEFNTSDVVKDIQTFVVDTETGAIGTDVVTVALAAERVRIVAGGVFAIRDGTTALVSLTGRFEIAITSTELAISVAARLALADGTINANVEGAALMRADGFAFQILAEASASASDSFAGAGFRLELGGAALVRINTINEFISEIAGVTVNLVASGGGTFFEVRLDGAGLIEFSIAGIGGFKIEGEVSTLLNSNGFAVTVNGDFTASLGDTVILRMHAAGAFQIFSDATSLADLAADDGIAGRVELVINEASLLSGTGFDLSGTFELEVNTTNVAVTEILGQTVNLEAGPYARVVASAIIRFSFGGSSSFELQANGAGQGLTIEMNATRIAIMADADVVAIVGGSELLRLSFNDGLLAVGFDGIVANIDLSGSIGGHLFSFTGGAKFKLNTTGDNVFINNSVVAPGVVVSIIGDLNLLGGFRLSGQFAIGFNVDGLFVDANADLALNIGGTPLISLELIDSFLQISDRGIAAQLSVGGRLSGAGFEFRSSTVMTLRVNTTGLAVNRINGRSVNLRGGYYAELHLVGDLAFLNALTLKGTFIATVANDGLDLSINATLSVMDIGFRIVAGARIRSSGIAMNAAVSLAVGGNTLQPISGISIVGSFNLMVNTTGSHQLGIAPHTVALRIHGRLNIEGFTIASTTFDVAVSPNGFSASFAGLMDVGILDISVSGSFDSSGHFSVTGSVGIDISAGPAFLQGSATVTISSTSGFSLTVSGSAGIRIGSFVIGVGVTGHVSVSPNGAMTIYAQACITINLLFTSFDICVGVNFSFGNRPGTPPTGTNTNPPPQLGTVSGGTLNLNLGLFGSHAQEISITNDAGGIRVSGNGYSQVFGGVSNISLNLGAGNDYLFIGPGVAADVNINGGSGDDEIIYLGSGSATINGGSGNDEIRVINDRNFRPEPTDGHSAILALSGGLGHVLIGGDGDDVLMGDNGNDYIDGGRGNDRLDGRGGNDTILGGDGDDTIYGGAGDDNLQGGNGNDVIYGEQGNDSLDGGFGDDILLGGTGDETIYWTVGTGNDIEINGGDGNDQIVLIGTGLDDTIVANAGEAGAFVATINGQSVPVNNFELATFQGLTGSDDVEVNDLTGSTVQQVNVDLGVDVVNDTVTVNGRPTDDEYTMTVSGQTVTITPTGGAPIVITNAGTTSGGSDITILAGEGNDTINIGQTLAGSRTVVYTGVGDDRVTIGDLTTDLTQIAGALTVHAEEHDDFLQFESTANTGGLNATLNSNTLVSSNIPAGLITFNGFETVDLDMGLGADTLTITANMQAVTIVDMGAGDDHVNVQTIQNNLTITTAAGDDIVRVGTLAPAAGSLLTGIQADLAIDGGTGNDQLFLDNGADTSANVLDITSTTVTITGPASAILYSNLENLDVTTGSAGDTVTVISTHTGTTTVHTGAGNDRLDVRAVSGQLTLNTAADDDVILLGSTAPALGGILNNLGAAVIVNAGDGNDSLQLDDTGDATDNTGTMTATMFTGLGMTGGVTYADFETVRLELGSGDDMLTIESTSTATNTINAGPGADDVFVETIAGTTTINGENGADEFNVSGTDSTLNGVLALLTINGGAGADALTISDSGDLAANSGELTGTTLRGLGMSHGIDYTSIANFTLTLGDGADTFTVFSTHTNTSTLNLSGGNDNIHIETIAGLTTVNGNDGNDTFEVSKLVAPATLPTIDHLTAPLALHGNAGSDTVTLDDRGDATHRVISVDGDAVGGLTQDPIGYFTMENLNILAGSGDDVLNVRGTTADTYIELNDGDERIFVSSDANANLTNADTIDFLTGHLDLLLGGDLDIRAGDGRHKLMISDEADLTGDTVTITDVGGGATALSSSGSGMEIIISGLAVSNISYGADATANFADGITIWTGWGDDVIDIDATHFRNAVDAGGHQLRTITTLNTGLGDDNITVTLLEGSDGFFALNSQGPHNDQPAFTDADTIDGSGSTLGLYLFGGQDQDTITGGSGRDIIFGDRGVVMFFDVLPDDISDLATILPGAVIVIGNGGPGDRTDGRVHEPSVGFGRDVTVGDDDLIRGGDGDDFLLGQNGDDQIYGEGGEDDIIGGHNILGGPDGDDFLDGGDAADVILGDNGSIVRTWNEATGEFERYAAPFDDVIRRIQLFDIADGVSGDDTLIGGDGDDILFGQLGDDTLDAGAGDNELIGGLGNNTLIGGGDTDYLIGGSARILRAVDEFGAPIVNANGSWHRDIVFELIGVVTDVIDIFNTPDTFTMWALAEKLLSADLILVVGVYDSDGNRVFDDERGEWKTRLLLINLDAPGNDVITGNAGDDIIIGGFGDDTLTGGDGDDLIIGDYGTSLLPYLTDLPLMFTGVQLRGDTTGTLALDELGTFIVPDFALDSALTATTVPQMMVVPEFARSYLSDLVYDDSIIAADSTVLKAFASIIPDVRRVENQPGNDKIDGEAGNDTLIGDNLLVRSPIDTINPAFTAVLNQIIRSLNDIQAAFYHAASLMDIVESGINGGTGGNTFMIGNDTIIGGDGNDTITGDNALWLTAAPYMWPVDEANIVSDGMALYSHLMDMNQALSDAEFTVRWGNQEAHLELLRARLLIPRATLNRSTLIVRNDTIDGGADNDTISGDDSIVDMPVVTSVATWRERLLEIRTLRRDNRRAFAELNREMTRLRISHNRDFALHIRRDRRVLRAPARVTVHAGRVSFHLTKGNDTIDAGTGNDLVAGDTLIVSRPALHVTPQNRVEAARLRGPMRRIVNRTRAIGMTVSGGANFRIALRIPPRIGPTLVEAQDIIQGGDGNDVLLGDNGEISNYIFRDIPFDPNNYEVRSLPRMGRVYSDNHRGGDDTIDGGAGDDVIDGRAGFDTLTGGAGADTISGGAHRDTINSDTDDIRPRQGGIVRRHTLVSFTNSWVDHINTMTPPAWRDMDPFGFMYARLRLRR